MSTQPKSSKLELSNFLSKPSTEKWGDQEPDPEEEPENTGAAPSSPLLSGAAKGGNYGVSLKSGGSSAGGDRSGDKEYRGGRSYGGERSYGGDREFRGGGRGFRGDRGDRGDRNYDRPRGGDRDRERPKLPVPDKPPFNAYVGNLDYNAVEDDLAEFFSKCQIEDIRIIEKDGRPKGYAYVDFKDKKSLEEALTLDGKDLNGRQIKVDVAPPRVEGERRDRSSFGGGRGGRGGGRGGFRDGGDRYGSRDSGSRYGGNDRFGDRDNRGGSFGGGRREWDDNRGSRDNFGSNFRQGDRYRADRDRDAPRDKPAEDGDKSAPAGSEEPSKERKKLQLAPRSAAPSTVTSPGGTARKNNDPFAGAPSREDVLKKKGVADPEKNIGSPKQGPASSPDDADKGSKKETSGDKSNGQSRDRDNRDRPSSSTSGRGGSSAEKWTRGGARGAIRGGGRGNSDGNSSRGGFDSSRSSRGRGGDNRRGGGRGSGKGISSLGPKKEKQTAKPEVDEDGFVTTSSSSNKKKGGDKDVKATAAVVTADDEDRGTAKQDNPYDLLDEAEGKQAEDDQEEQPAKKAAASKPSVKAAPKQEADVDEGDAQDDEGDAEGDE